MVLTRIKKLASLMNWEFMTGVTRRLLFAPGKVRTFSVAGLRMQMRSPSFVAQYRSIFIDQEYRFRYEGECPRILDLGANVGMSCVYFKRLFPKGEIWAFEPDKELFPLLEQNLKSNGIEGVEAINLAAWIRDEKISFAPNGLGGGAIDVPQQGGEDEKTQADAVIDAIDLRQWLQGRQFDFIKMDIEGAENQVIPHCIDELCQAEQLVLEHHSVRNEPQHLGNILTAFSERGFRYYIRTVDLAFNPFATPLKGRFDNHVVVYLDRCH